MRNSILCQKRISLQLYIGDIIVRNREHFIHKSHRKQFFGLTHPTAADLPSILIANAMGRLGSLKGAVKNDKIMIFLKIGFWKFHFHPPEFRFDLLV